MILLFFCTCNPPHDGHAYALRLALSQIPDVEKILVIPPRKHVWGKETLPFEERLSLARGLFLPIDPRIEVSRLEEANDLSGYTIDTLHHLKKIHPGSQFGLLVGEDTLAVFDKWKDWQEILELVKIFVAPTWKASQEGLIASEQIEKFLGDRIILLKSPYLAAGTLSSSDIRARLMV